jgi:glucokinase
MGNHVVACDIGGSFTRVGVAGSDCRIRQLLRTPTPSSLSDLVGEVSVLSAEAARRVGWSPSNAMSVGVTVPAAVDPSGATIGYCGNLPSISGHRFGQAMCETFGIPVAIENDANAAVLGERLHGGARGESDVVMVVVGTGVGVGAVVDGRLLRGKNGAAGEIGYVPVGPEPLHPEDVRPATLHDLVSGSGISQLAASMHADHPDTVIRSGATAAEVFAAAAAGDPLGHAVLTTSARHLVQALNAVVALLDPAVVLLGGGVGSNPSFVAAVAGLMTSSRVGRPSVRAAELADLGGVVGAAALALAAVDVHPDDLRLGDGVSPIVIEDATVRPSGRAVR